MATTWEDVNKVLPADYTEEQIEPFLSVAQSIVDANTCAQTNYTSSVLDKLVLWMTADLVIRKDGGSGIKMREKIDDGEIEWAVKSGEDSNSMRVLNALDYKGCLSTAFTKKKFYMKAHGPVGSGT